MNFWNFCFLRHTMGLKFTAVLFVYAPPTQLRRGHGYSCEATHISIKMC